MDAWFCLEDARKAEENLVFVTKKRNIKIEHLKKREDITRLIFSSRRNEYGLLSVRYCKNYFQISRFLFIPQKKFGTSIERNKVRRRLNEICRMNLDKIKCGYDIGIYVKKDAINLSYADLCENVLELLKKNELLEIGV